MSSLADEYRRYADECVTWAGHAKTVHAREIFLKMAQDWLFSRRSASGTRGCSEFKHQPWFLSLSRHTRLLNQAALHHSGRCGAVLFQPP